MKKRLHMRGSKPDLFLLIFKRIMAAALCLAVLFLVRPEFSCKGEEAIPLPRSMEGEKKTVTIAVNLTDALYLDKDGKLSGYAAEYVTYLAEICNWELQYVDKPFGYCLQELQNGKLDILFPAMKESDYKDEVQFARYQAGYLTYALTARADSDVSFNEVGAFEGKKIALIKDTYADTALKAYAQKKGFTYEPVYLEQETAIESYLISKQVDLAAMYLGNGTNSYKVVAALDAAPVYFAVGKDNDELLKKLNAGMRYILLENPDLAIEMTNAYTGGEAIGKMIALNEAESRWLKDNQEVVIGFYDETEPLAYIDKNGEYQGIYIDYVRKLQEISGMNIRLYPINRENEYSLKLLEEGKIDLILGMDSQAFDEAIGSSYKRTDKLMDYQSVCVVRKNYQNDTEKSIVIALTKAKKYWGNSLCEQYPNAKLQYYTSAKECLLAVASGEADMTIVHTYEFNYYTKSTRFRNLMEIEYDRKDTGVVMGAGEDIDPIILSIINKSICKISSEDVQNMVSYQLNLPYHSTSVGDAIYGIRYVLAAILLMAVLSFVLMQYLNKVRMKNLKALEENNEQLALANQAKSEFMSRMSHDFRTPLNVIIGMSELAKENDNLPDTNQCLDKINVAGEFLLGLINDILDMSKVESGKITLHEAPYAVCEFHEYMYTMADSLCRMKEIQFAMESNVTDRSLALLTDKLRINQICFNLLSNAAKFTPSGGSIRMKIEVEPVSETKMRVAFMIVDTGIGMSEEFQKKMFDAFSQEEHALQPINIGTGLGLTIVKKLCDLMKIDIEVDSHVGVGTTFRLSGIFPLAQNETEIQKTAEKTIGSAVTANEDAVSAGENVKTASGAVGSDAACESQIAKNDQKPAPQDALAEAMQVLKGKTVLVCEDHPMNQEIIRRLLAKTGAKVVVASDGREGLKMFEQSALQEFAVILMDIRMPNLNGLDASRAIRALDRLDARTVPILAMTANATPEDEREAEEAGMSAYLTKPIKPQLMYAVLAEKCR